MPAGTQALPALAQQRSCPRTRMPAVNCLRTHFEYRNMSVHARIYTGVFMGCEHSASAHTHMRVYNVCACVCLVQDACAWTTYAQGTSMCVSTQGSGCWPSENGGGHEGAGRVQGRNSWNWRPVSPCYIPEAGGGGRSLGATSPQAPPSQRTQ